MAIRTFFEWPGTVLRMWLERWHGNIVVVGKNQAMKMMLEKAEEEDREVSVAEAGTWVVERWHPKPEDVMRTCTRPPSGWFCTRKAGHDGPCAARMATFHFPDHPVIPRKPVVFNDEECKIVTADFSKIEERVLAEYTDFKTFKEAYGEAGSNKQQAQESAREEEPAGAGSVPAPEAGTAGD